jgi:hypothetical protein
LLAVGTDEEDLAGSDAVVDPDLVCSYVVTCFVRGFLGGVEELVPDATMADRRRPPSNNRRHPEGLAAAQHADPGHLCDVVAGWGC